jgi:hypothetical protein
LEDDALRIATLAQTMAASRILHALTQQLLTKGLLDNEDTRAIFAYALSELDETTAKPLLPEFGRALRAAKTLVEQEMTFIGDG